MVLKRKKVLVTFCVKWNFSINCDSNENICEAIIIIRFPCKQSIKKHSMNKFNLIHFDCRIQILLICWWIGKTSMCFSCFYHSKYHKSIMPPLHCDFLRKCTFSYGHLFSVSIFYQLTSEKNRIHTGDLTHCRCKPYNWLNFIWSKTWRAIEETS